jgi:hypothetical protein
MKSTRKSPPQAVAAAAQVNSRIATREVIVEIGPIVATEIAAAAAVVVAVVTTAVTIARAKELAANPAEMTVAMIALTRRAAMNPAVMNPAVKSRAAKNLAVKNPVATIAAPSVAISRAMTTARKVAHASTMTRSGVNPLPLARLAPQKMTRRSVMSA